MKDFSKSLVKAAKSIGAWIITNGLNVGVVKEIGEIIRDDPYYDPKFPMMKKLVTIGIAPWTMILHNEKLNQITNQVIIKFIIT